MTNLHGEVVGDVAPQFVDEPYSRDTRSNKVLAEFVGFATKSVIEARMWWEDLDPKVFKAYLFDESEGDLFQHFDDEEARLTEGAATDYFDYFHYQRLNATTLDLARNSLARATIGVQRTGYCRPNYGILKYTTTPLRTHSYESSPTHDEYYRDGKVEFVDSDGRFIRTPLAGSASIAVADQVNAEIYTAQGATQPTFTPEDFKFSWKGIAGTKTAVKLTPTNIPGIESMEEIRVADNKAARDPNNRYFSVTFRLIPEPRPDSQD